MRSGRSGPCCAASNSQVFGFGGLFAGRVGVLGAEVRLGDGPGAGEERARGGFLELAGLVVAAEAREEVQALLGARGGYI